ncbi:MAG: glycosyltransferase, partial [Bryobacteraceae bacterium]
MTGIVIVTYNSAALIDGCLAACLRLGNTHVVVVDNASRDGTPDVVRTRPEVQLITNPVNRGFAGAANQGIDAAPGETILLLNPDALLESGIESLNHTTLAP